MPKVQQNRAFRRRTLNTVFHHRLLAPMFARKIRVEYEVNGQRRPCPLKWLDSFSMRNFTNASLFDDTLPVAVGLMEIGTNVPTDQLQAAMEDWFRRKNYLPKSATVVLGSESVSK